MRKKQTKSGVEGSSQLYGLLAALSDDLALPLLQIKSVLELISSDNFSKVSALAHAQTMLLSADNGLQLIEAYRLVLKAADPDSRQFEPVAIGAVLQAVAHELSPYAKKYNTALEVDIQRSLTPVLVHQPSLVAAIQVLSSSIIRAQAATSQQKNYRLLLAAHRVGGSDVSAGVFSSVQGLSDRTLRTARALMGRARQPLPSVPAGAASGVLIADMLCTAMWQPLRAAAHGGLHGLVTAVPISKQLQFV
ncbi:HAMP domain-containing histidine kinase [Candidatus Saccharibacteria bacterium]|nr:HAMP domain-containing histidine kinase [Candidatus Saccharibacteria bacterium]